MEQLEQLVLIVHVILAVLILGLILIQQGKGADMGASFGSGASQTLMGVQGSGNVLTRWTSLLCAMFFATSLTLAYFAREKSRQVDEFDLQVPAVIETPVDAGQDENSEIPVLEDIPEAEAIIMDEDVPVMEDAGDSAPAESQPTQ